MDTLLLFILFQLACYVHSCFDLPLWVSQVIYDEQHLDVPEVVNEL